MSDTAADSREGSQFGPYRLGRLNGRGGMGDFYEAKDAIWERTVAPKLMSQTPPNEPRLPLPHAARSPHRKATAGTAPRSCGRAPHR